MLQTVAGNVTGERDWGQTEPESREEERVSDGEGDGQRDEQKERWRENEWKT